MLKITNNKSLQEYASSNNIKINEQKTFKAGRKQYCQWNIASTLGNWQIVYSEVTKEYKMNRLCLYPNDKNLTLYFTCNGNEIYLNKVFTSGRGIISSKQLKDYKDIAILGHCSILLQAQIFYTR